MKAAVCEVTGSERNVLFLATTGRRTGKTRTSPVFYLRDGEAIVIVTGTQGDDNEKNRL